MTSDVLSALDWWSEAGVDVLVDEQPRDWLAPPRAAVTTTIDAANAQAASKQPAIDSLEAIHALYAEDAIFGRPDGRLLPEGAVASGLMLITDQPEGGDAEAGQLVAGEAGRLFDRMLAAIGRDRASIYLAAMTPARVPGGRPQAGALGRWTEIAHRHVDLAAPRMLLVLGDAASRAFLGMSLAEARGRVHQLNREGHNVPVIATFHPRFLLQQPARKADAWKDLRLLLEELSR